MSIPDEATGHVNISKSEKNLVIQWQSRELEEGAPNAPNSPDLTPLD